MEFWVEKQGCLPPRLNFCTILYFVESFTKFTYMKKQGCLPPILLTPTFAQFCTLLKVLQNSHIQKNNDVCHQFFLTPTQLFCTILYLVKSFAKFTYMKSMKNNDVCRQSSHQTLMLTPTLAIQLAHFCTFCTFFLAKQI